MAGDVTNLVVEEYSRPMRWRSCDCCSAACNVFEQLTGINPMQGVEYDTAVGAARVIARFGGLLPFAEHLAERSGLVSGIGAAGEIGISKQGVAIGFSGRCLAVCLGHGIWAIKTSEGFATIKEVEKSWQHP